MSTHKPPNDLTGTMGVSAARRLFGALVQDEVLAADLPHLEGYVLSRLLGRGGGGVVYLGHRAESDRRLAIKLLRKPLNGGAGADRAWRELDVMTQLRLSCTPRVHDYGVHEGRMYIATEHVDGLPLAEHCRANNLTLRQRVGLLARVAEAVATIHERGVIHRDLKPDNVLIDATGEPVIIDLGIAFLLGADVTETLTADGVSIGTPAFMSPEQARGERAAISTRSDVYSLGATACRILTGQTPHDLGSSSLLEAIHKVGHERPRDPRALEPKLPEPLAAILVKALAARPEDRFGSATELADDLRRWLENKPPLSQPPSWWRDRWLSIKRHPARWAWGSAAGFMIVGLTVLSTVSTVQAAEAQGAQEWKEKYENMLRKASLAFSDRLRNTDFDQALGTMKFLEDHVDAGFFVFEDGEERVRQTQQRRNALTVETLAVIHAAEARQLGRMDLALAAVEAVYEYDDAWDPVLGSGIEALLLDHETTVDDADRAGRRLQDG